MISLGYTVVFSAGILLNMPISYLGVSYIVFYLENIDIAIMGVRHCSVHFTHVNSLTFINLWDYYNHLHFQMKKQKHDLLHTSFKSQSQKWQKSEVAQSCPTLCDPVDCSPPGSSSMGFSREEYWSGSPFPSPGDLPDPGIEPRSPALQADALTSEPPGKPQEEDMKPLMRYCLQDLISENTAFTNKCLNGFFLCGEC